MHPSYSTRPQSLINFSNFLASSIETASSLVPHTNNVGTKILSKQSVISKLTVSTNEFYSLLDRVSLFSTEEEKNTIKLECNDNTMVVSSNIPEIGNVVEKLEVEKNNQENIKIAFSSKYMMDAIKVLDCEKIELAFNGEIKPIIIKNPEDENLIQLIVPIKTY